MQVLQLCCYTKYQHTWDVSFSMELLDRNKCSRHFCNPLWLGLKDFFCVFKFSDFFQVFQEGENPDTHLKQNYEGKRIKYSLGLVMVKRSRRRCCCREWERGRERERGRWRKRERERDREKERERSRENTENIFIECFRTRDLVQATQSRTHTYMPIGKFTTVKICYVCYTVSRLRMEDATVYGFSWEIITQELIWLHTFGIHFMIMKLSYGKLNCAHKGFRINISLFC